MTEVNDTPDVINPETRPPNNGEMKELMETAANKMLLAPCPCGLTPDKLFVEIMQPGKYARAMGDCCGNWSIEFRLLYEQDPVKAQAKAAEAWNSTPIKL